MLVLSRCGRAIGLRSGRRAGAGKEDGRRRNNYGLANARGELQPGCEADPEQEGPVVLYALFRALQREANEGSQFHKQPGTVGWWRQEEALLTQKRNTTFPQKQEQEQQWQQHRCPEKLDTFVIHRNLDYIHHPPVTTENETVVDSRPETAINSTALRNVGRQLRLQGQQRRQQTGRPPGFGLPALQSEGITRPMCERLGQCMLKANAEASAAA